MAGLKVALATLRGGPLVKKVCIGTVLGLAAGGMWKMHQWNNKQWKVRAFYALVDESKTSVTKG